MRIDQFIPVLDPGDAASNHTLQVQRLLRDLGHVSDIFTELTHPSLRDAARPYRDHDGAAVLYQFAIGSAMADHLLASSGPLAVNHHNVTPARFFEVWDPPLVHGTAWGERQLEALAVRASHAVAVSRFNAESLIAAGFKSVAVAPILLDTDAFDRAADPDRVRELATGGPAVLFVGRIVPNKAQHRLVNAFSVLRRTRPDVRLWLVGGASSPAYEKALRSTIDALGLDDAIEMTGSVGTAELAARYRAAAVFACVSEHEGFCVPLVEAMHHGLPVVAVDVAAVGETVGDGALLLRESRAEVVACALERVLDDDRLRTHLIDAGYARVGALGLEPSRQRFVAAIDPWLRSL